MAIVNTALKIQDLPAPPEGKTGWPWTDQGEALPDKMPDGSEWPRISIVTPNYNYGRFIEETIRSVLLQGYPNLEYVVVDGGSTDNSVEVIKKYEPWLTYWVSEKDLGQTDAINKGYKFCTGDIFAWINSDDAYRDYNCLKSVAELHANGYEFIVGECLVIDKEGQQDLKRQMYGESRSVRFTQYLRFWKYPSLPQPAVFINKNFLINSFPLDTDIFIVMDLQLFLRVLKQKPKSIWVKEKWVNFKYHGQNKTGENQTKEFDGFQEIYKLVLSESESLPFIPKSLYRIELENHKSIHNLLNQEDFPHFFQVVSCYLKRPLLLYWPLFWKILGKSLLGDHLYTQIKTYWKK